MMPSWHQLSLKLLFPLRAQVCPDLRREARVARAEIGRPRSSVLSLSLYHSLE